MNQPMTDKAKQVLAKKIRELRARLIEDLGEATERAYRLSLEGKKAKLDEAARIKRARLEGWIDEQVRPCRPRAAPGRRCGCQPGAPQRRRYARRFSAHPRPAAGRTQPRRRMPARAGAPPRQDATELGLDPAPTEPGAARLRRAGRGDLAGGPRQADRRGSADAAAARDLSQVSTRRRGTR